MPQLSQEVNLFNQIHIVNLSMNQLIRKFISSGFVTSAGHQNHHLPNVLALLYYWLIPPLSGHGGVDGLMKKISKNRHLSLWRASFTCSS